MKNLFMTPWYIFCVQVSRFLRPGVESPKDKIIYFAVNLPSANKYFPCEENVVKQIGEVGKANAIIDFLDNDSSDESKNIYI